MKIIVTIIPINLITNLLLSHFFLNRIQKKTAKKDFEKLVPTGKIYVRGIFVEHSHDIFSEYSEKVPYESQRNILK